MCTWAELAERRGDNAFNDNRRAPLNNKVVQLHIREQNLGLRNALWLDPSASPLYAMRSRYEEMWQCDHIFHGAGHLHNVRLNTGGATVCGGDSISNAEVLGHGR
mmetsp:Transcript_32441/g.85149  ORF Transcript_32441/g.85149 Transcript_32441/m.85149 type:complete len:105 (-) Transcript_32441:1433-1747(-)